MTESFEEVMAEMRKVITDDCDQTYCAMYDDDCYACEGAVLDRLQKAHDHEMEQLRRSRFREGYVAGQRSMDAEHYAVALRLKHLPLDEDSHGNLSQIARAVWHSDFGWTRGACEALRDELVRLLGGVHDEPAPIPASRCACDADCDCGHGDETAVAYDVLGNERNKAVCRLREFVPMIGHKPTEEASKLIRCITGNDDSHVACGNDLEETRDRLIYLLGGDEPNLPKSAEIAKPESDDGGEVTITDELRKFATDPLLGYASQELHVERITAIADRIDEQFNRICWQQEAVLQSTIDTMVDERDKLVDNRDMWRGKAMQLADVVDRYVGRCEDLLDLLRDAAVDFKNASYSWNYALIVGENITIETERNSLLKERDELQKKLEDTQAAMNRATGRWAKVDAEKRELQRTLREIAERAGVPHDVDLDEYSDDLVAKATLGKIDSTHEYIGSLEWQRDRQRKLLDKYENADTPEEIVRDIHLGIVTDSQAIERIRALR